MRPMMSIYLDRIVSGFRMGAWDADSGFSSRGFRSAPVRCAQLRARDDRPGPRRSAWHARRSWTGRSQRAVGPAMGSRFRARQRPETVAGRIRRPMAPLREGPRNGYQMMSEIEERSGGAWRPSPGAVYPALQQLADEGLIVAEESGGRRTFSLTDAGRIYVEENPEMARGAWESVAQHEPGEIPGLFAQAARLGAGIVQMAHAGTPDQIRAAERLLEQTRRRLYQILAEDDEPHTTNI